MTNRQWVILLVWVVILLLLNYIYFLHPEIFQRMFHYPGADSPFINTPTGEGN